MNKLLKLAVSAAIALLIPATYAASKPFTAFTAPDTVSRAVLLSPLSSVNQGGIPGADDSQVIHRNFSQIIEQNFARLNAADAAALLDRLSERELSDLAVFYNTANADSGHQDRLLPILATRLDTRRLTRLSHHFGYAPVYSALMQSAPAQATAFALAGNPTDVAAVPHTAAALMIDGNLAHPGKLAFGGISAQSAISPIMRYYNWTVSEVYLDLRTAPIGSLGAAGAAVETGAIFFGGASLAWTAGQTAGSALNWVLETYTPDLYTTIGGTIDQVFQNYQAASTLVSQGRYFAGIVTMFGVTPAQSVPMSNSDGDYGTTTAYTYYTGYTTSGGSGGCTYAWNCHPSSR